MASHLTKKMKEDSKLESAKREFKARCEKCKHLVSFYPFEKYDRKICRYCGIWVYKDKLAKEKYQKEDFERKLKKFMKESDKNDKTIERRTKNNRKNRKNY